MKMSISRTVVSILGSDLEIEGNIVSEGEVYILGTLKGSVTARKLTVGKGGMVDGRIDADTVVINGSVSGSLSAATALLCKTASVNADITYVTIEIHSGAFHNGHIRRVESIGAIAAEVTELPLPKREGVRALRGF